jgi:hypothetical protein
VQVTALALQTAGSLLAVCPDVVELLVVMALHKTILSSICLYLIEMWQRLGSQKMYWDFAVLGNIIRKGRSLWLLIPRDATDVWLSSA